ncbi:MAG: hypothetical protein DYG84_15195 [Candidatus Brocadia sp. AMX3]|nr:hypothetical protein [Candidatus Brocadia sp. AMX3]
MLSFSNIEALNGQLNVCSIMSPGDKSVDVWTAITLQISSKDSCDWAYVSIIEKLINKYVLKLKENTLRTLWKETEVGMQCPDDEGFPADSLRHDLEMELLDLITHRAWEEGQP